MSGENQLRSADAFRPAEGNTAHVAIARHRSAPRRRRHWHTLTPPAREPGYLWAVPAEFCRDPLREGRRPKPTMNGPEKSELAHSSSEACERSGARRRAASGAKGQDRGECGPANHGPDADREAVSHAQARIREAVTRNRAQPLTTLLHHVSVDVLRAGILRTLKKNAAPGVDGLT